MIQSVPLEIGITTAVVVVHIDTHYLYLFPRAIAVYEIRGGVCVCVHVSHVQPKRLPFVRPCCRALQWHHSLLKANSCPLRGTKRSWPLPLLLHASQSPRGAAEQRTPSQISLGTGADPREWGFPLWSPIALTDRLSLTGPLLCMSNTLIEFVVTVGMTLRVMYCSLVWGSHVIGCHGSPVVTRMHFTNTILVLVFRMLTTVKDINRRD